MKYSIKDLQERCLYDFELWFICQVMVDSNVKIDRADTDLDVKLTINGVEVDFSKALKELETQYESRVNWDAVMLLQKTFSKSIINFTDEVDKLARRARETLPPVDGEEVEGAMMADRPDALRREDDD